MQGKLLPLPLPLPLLPTCRWQRWSVVEAGMRGTRDATSAATSRGLVPKVRVPAPMNRKPSAMLQVARMGRPKQSCSTQFET